VCADNKGNADKKTVSRPWEHKTGRGEEPGPSAMQCGHSQKPIPAQVIDACFDLAV